MERPNENLFSYLRWRGDLSFAADPLNEVDALAFAVFSYLDYSAVPDGLDLKSAAAVVKKTMVSPRTSLVGRLEALEQAKEPTIPELLSRYLDKRSEERTGWTSKGKLKGTVGDFNKVMEALDFLRQKEISTVESLDAYLDEASAQAVSIREEIRPMEKRVKEIDRLLFHLSLIHI